MALVARGSWIFEKTLSFFGGNDMKLIEKIKLQNFKRFETFEVEFDKNINIFIGDNEAGKSTILSAIDIVLNRIRHREDVYR